MQLCSHSHLGDTHEHRFSSHAGCTRILWPLWRPAGAARAEEVHGRNCLLLTKKSCSARTFRTSWLRCLPTMWVAPAPSFTPSACRTNWAARRFISSAEDLNHTGAHKINHCLGEALLAKFMGKKKVIAETGAASMAWPWPQPRALVGIPCEIHMGQVDIEKEHPNVTKMPHSGLQSGARYTRCGHAQGGCGQRLQRSICKTFEHHIRDWLGWSALTPPMMVRDFPVHSWAGRHASSSRPSMAGCPTMWRPAWRRQQCHGIFTAFLG